MDIQQLRYFHVVAQNEHVTKSARQLNIAQPALSQSIARLERELGCPLFEHVGRNIRLTPQGRYFDMQIAPLLDRLKAATDNLASFDRDEKQTIHLDIRAASSMLVDVLAVYRARNPQVRFALRQHENDPLCDLRVTCHPTDTRGVRTDDGTRTLVIGPGTEAADCADERVRSAVLTERILIAVSPERAAGETAPVELDRFAADGFICLAPGNAFRRICDEACRSCGFTPQIGCESDNPQVVQKMIALGLGVGFWPEHSWGAVDRAQLRLLPLAEQKFARDIVIEMTRPDPKDATRAFFGFLVEYLAHELTY